MAKIKESEMIIDLDEKILDMLDDEYDLRFDHWIKHITGIDRSHKNGYMFTGDFIQSGDVEISGPMAILAMTATGSRKNQTHHYNVIVFDNNSLTKTGISTNSDRKGWALRIRDDVAVLLNKLSLDDGPGTYHFTVTLAGTGDSADEAWRDACEGFSLDEGETPADYELVEEGNG